MLAKRRSPPIFDTGWFAVLDVRAGRGSWEASAQLQRCHRQSIIANKREYLSRREAVPLQQALLGGCLLSSDSLQLLGGLLRNLMPAVLKVSLPLDRVVP